MNVFPICPFRWLLWISYFLIRNCKTRNNRYWSWIAKKFRRDAILKSPSQRYHSVNLDCWRICRQANDDKRRRLLADSGGGNTYSLIWWKEQSAACTSAIAQCRPTRRRALSSLSRSRDRKIAIERSSCIGNPRRWGDSKCNPARCKEIPWFSTSSKILHFIIISSCGCFTHVYSLPFRNAK